MKNKDFQIVYKKGKSYANKYLIMYVLNNNRVKNFIAKGTLKKLDS